MTKSNGKKSVNHSRQRRTSKRYAWTLYLVASLLITITGFARAFGDPRHPSAAEIIAPPQKSYQELVMALGGNSKGVQGDPKAIADQLDRLLQRLEEDERRIPRDTFDLRAIIQKIGTDPIKAFEWVRDETYLAPYRGILRADKGVLMDRRGNSLDRALLLSALSRSTGHQVRLAHGLLSERQATDVMQKARAISRDRIAALWQSRTITDSVVQKAAVQNHIEPAELRKRIDSLAVDQKRMSEAVTWRLSEQAAFIAAAVGKPKEDIRKTEEAAAIEALRDHWWVEWQNGSAWVDLDPTLPDAKPGQTLADARETVTPDALPGTLQHEVRIQVVIEKLEAGQLSEAAVLTHVLRPSALYEDQIVLSHIPLKWPKDLNILQEKDPLQSLKTAVLAQDEWLPVLTVGSAKVAQRSFTDAGNVIETPMAPLLGGAPQTLGGQIGGILAGGGIGQAVPAREPKRNAYLTAEWIDYEIRSPGQTVRKVRREIFDLIGPAARLGRQATLWQMSDTHRLDRGLALLGETQILPVVSRMTPEFFDHLVSRNLLENRAVLIYLLRNVDQLDLKSLMSKAGEMAWLPGGLYALALARWEWSRFPGDVYLSSPNILAYHRYVRVSAKGEVRTAEGFDIVANDVSVQPGSTSSPFDIRVQQGVVDSNAEALVAAAIFRLVKDESAYLHIENTAELFTESRARGVEWPLLKEPRDVAARVVGLPRDVRARIDEELAAGYVVLVPAASDSERGREFVGWWRIDPRTGETIGVGDLGRGVAAAEYSLTKGFITGAVTGGALGYLSCQIQGGELALKTLKKCRQDLICGAVFGGIGGLLAAWLAGGVVAAQGSSQLLGPAFRVEGVRAAVQNGWIGTGGAVGGAVGPAACTRFVGHYFPDSP